MASAGPSATRREIVALAVQYDDGLIGSLVTAEFWCVVDIRHDAASRWQ
jgi:hypothetical protein